MPKYGVHHVVLSDAIDKLRESGVEAGEILANNYEMAMLGAIGPDLFFWAPDYPVVQVFQEIYRAIDFVVQAYNRTIKPFADAVDAVEDKLEEMVSDLAPATAALIQTAKKSLEDTLDLFNRALSTGALAGALGGINLLTDTASLPRVTGEIFRAFTPPRQWGWDIRRWYWFDMLHYRKTGAFARQLIEIAHKGSEPQRAYAYGYLSHIATDLTGHPYVNQIVGGPFRLHVQRHATVENYIDGRVFRDRFGESVNQTLFKRLGLESLEVLPGEIVRLLDRAFQGTYPNEKFRPPFLGRKQIRETYRNFHEILRLMADMAMPYPTEPFAEVGRILAEALEDLLEPPPDVPGNPTSNCTIGDILSFGATPESRRCYDSLFRQLDRYLQYLGRLMTWLVETATDLADLLSAALTSIPVSGVLALMYGLQVTFYEIYQNLRSVLVLEGIVSPELRDLETAHGRNLTTPFQECTPDLFETYPSLTTTNISHLVCPLPQTELPATSPAFYQPGSEQVTPEDFISGVTFSQGTFADYARADPDETQRYHHQRRRVGNAIDLAKWMITVASDENGSAQDKDDVFANFDLDADRGYFFRTWRGRIEADRVQGLSYTR